MSMTQTFLPIMDRAWEKVLSWSEQIVSMLPNFVVAVLLLLLFFPLARAARALSKRLAARTTDSQALQGLIGQVAFLLTLAFGMVMALSVLHLDRTVTSLLAGAGIVGIALGFAFQDISANFIAGVFMAVKRPIRVGDLIETNGYTGKVEQVDLRTTSLRTFQGLLVILPNKMVFQEPLLNYTMTDKRRVDLQLGVSYDDDLRKAVATATDALSGLEMRKTTEPVQVNFTGFGASSIDLIATFWIDFPEGPGFLESRNEAVIRLKKAFDDHGISIPYPIRTLDLGKHGSITVDRNAGQ